MAAFVALYFYIMGSVASIMPIAVWCEMTGRSFNGWRPLMMVLWPLFIPFLAIVIWR